ncbi:MAG: MFS transporter [Gemmataceae bacterium]|nr:MFS transporter [Gemmataceae bacterium]
MPQRYVIVGITAVAALWLYIDRVCFSTLADPIKLDLLLPAAPEPPEADRLSAAQREVAVEAVGQLGVTVTESQVAAAEAQTYRRKWADQRMSYVLGAFFFTYALFQIPLGALADRCGARAVLAVSIAAWSLVTAATGFAQSFAALLAIRLMLGVTESGAYPAAAGLVKSWARPTERGRFSSVVALGGRIGGALAPWLTTALIAAFAGLVLFASANPSGVNWRGVLVFYGLCGLTVAALFWLIVRDRPPGAVVEKAAESVRKTSFLRRLGLLARSRNMWLFGALQFGVNLGWAFLVTLFPTYLNEAFEVPLERRGPMQSMVLTIGCFGMFFGGLFTDALRTRLGPKLGRTVPLGVALCGCAAALFLVPTFASVWLVVGALGLMAFLVDLHNPTIWSFAQDVGGKNVGAALGWGNMWGNLGAALSPVLLTAIKAELGWNVVFVVGGSAFAAAAACGLLLDATKPVDPGDV